MCEHWGKTTKVNGLKLRFGENTGLCGYFRVILFSRISRVRHRENFHFNLCLFEEFEFKKR